MATFIDGTEEEHALEMTKFYCKLMSISIEGPQVTEFYNRLTPLIPKSNDTLVQTLLSSHNNIFADAVVDADIEACIRVLIALSLTNNKQHDAFVQQFCENITSKTNRPELRLKLLSHLFNALPASAHRAVVFKAMIAFAIQNQLVHLLERSFTSVGTWAHSWGLTKAQLIDLYAAIYDAIKSRKWSQAHIDVVTAFVQLGDSTNAEKFEEAAAALSLNSVQHDTIFGFDTLSEVPAVQALSANKNAKYVLAHKLLHLFASENLDAFETFVKANEAALASLGVDVERCRAKMRILTLASLATSAHELTYDVVAKHLHVASTEVEFWVIRTMNAKLLTGKINQIDQVIHVSGSTRRTLKEVEWKQLQTNIQAWRDNMKSLLGVIHDARVKTAGAQADVTART
eukprot:c52269_g1_i1.p1 GENE.c52269_g1_i1~~c52269_g1_i1.p1  ORF type:complete len:401 (-),score=93.99 c52269_g1_i1:112-1314(-)